MVRDGAPHGVERRRLVRLRRHVASCKSVALSPALILRLPARECLAGGIACWHHRAVMGAALTKCCVHTSEPEGLPPMAHKMVGSWINVKSENYRLFLSECLRLPKYKYLIAERLSPLPTFEIRDGGKTLHCITHCKATIPVEEDLITGSNRLFEPNLSSTYVVDAEWIDGVFTDTRVCPEVNGGQPIHQKRWVDEATGQLNVHQSWGTGVTFVALFNRAPDKQQTGITNGLLSSASSVLPVSKVDCISPRSPSR